MKRTLVLFFCVLDYVISCLGCAVSITTGELIPAGGSCYQVVAESLSRQAATDRCTSGGGFLGVLPNNASLTEVGNRVKVLSESGSLSSTVFWLGMNVTRGRFLKENGQEVMWSADVVQPSGSIPQGSCVLLSLLSGDPSLISADCNVSYWMYGYVCQYAQSSSDRLKLSFLTILMLFARAIF
ncbi:uncharacterized protein LOC125658390 isoform X2 [Ostrea edulis]|uniref:uncharacterized protein LOC125658390 isoform X2 n=1 Tax=Ostrea edulis TaxID=37623 RepID=UPI0024AEC8DA|nr:uncharacterized protein LOC125658390 isoform X2 [Ostrea edulis]